MTSINIILFLFLFPSLLLLRAVSEIEYTFASNASGTRGSIRFDNEIGADYGGQTMKNATEFIWNIFQQNTFADRKNVQRVRVLIDKELNQNGSVAYTINNDIHISENYIANYHGGDLKREITGVLYHEMTHIWQWFGNPMAPSGLIEGIADYVLLKSEYIPEYWDGPGIGRSWDQGYEVTARFLDYLEGLRSGFVAKLNGRLKNGYTPKHFEDLVGKPVDQLWADYKVEYPNKCSKFIRIEANGVFPTLL